MRQRSLDHLLERLVPGFASVLSRTSVKVDSKQELTHQRRQRVGFVVTAFGDVRRDGKADPPVVGDGRRGDD